MNRPLSHNRTSASRGFTLMEMMTAVVLLVLVIISVGIIFKSTGKTVGMSIVATEMLSNARSAQQQIEADVGNLNRSGFIVIRSRLDPGGSGRRFDQICFVASGTYVNRTGNAYLRSDASATTPFSDATTANSRVVWYGHLVVEDNNSAGGAHQDVPVHIDDLPTGTLDKEFVLGRHTTLLLCPPSTGVTSGLMVSPPPTTVQPVTNKIAVYADAALSTPNINPGGGESAAHISSSRICTVAATPASLMQTMMVFFMSHTRATFPRLEADNYCYRFKTLANVYASEVGSPPSLINAAFRMHPILLQGVPTFAVDWTDGTTYGDVNLFGNTDPITGLTGLTGSTRWYGLGNPKQGLPASDFTQPPVSSSGDGYTAIFSFDNKTVSIGGVMTPNWPKALRFRYRVTDPNDRLNGGRDFVQVVKIPD